MTFGAVVVTGHTDRIGALPYNIQISERLATVVKDYLVNAEHVDPALIIWEGKGPVQPIPVTEFCNNKMTSKQIIECLAPNRRVTIEVIGTAKTTSQGHRGSQLSRMVQAIQVTFTRTHLSPFTT